MIRSLSHPELLNLIDEHAERQKSKLIKSSTRISERSNPRKAQTE